MMERRNPNKHSLPLKQYSINKTNNGEEEICIYILRNIDTVKDD